MVGTMGSILRSGGFVDDVERVRFEGIQSNFGGLEVDAQKRDFTFLR